LNDFTAYVIVRFKNIDIIPKIKTMC